MKRQSNIQSGIRSINAGENLTDKELFLVKLADAGSVAEVLLPTAITDLALHVVEEGSTLDTECKIRPLQGGEQIRLVAKGAGSAGAVLTLADPSTAADKGKVRSIPATAGLHFSPGVAEEDFVDGQEVVVRVCPRMVNVASADTITGAADLAALKAALVPILQAHGIVA